MYYLIFKIAIVDARGTAEVPLDSREGRANPDTPAYRIGSSTANRAGLHRHKAIPFSCYTFITNSECSVLPASARPRSRGFGSF